MPLIFITDGTPEGDTRQGRVGAARRAATRARLLAAAASQFASHGYVGATVTRIAAEAGVTVQTLHTVGGAKRDLLRGVLVMALAGGGDPSDTFAEEVSGSGETDPGGIVDRIVAVFLAVAERAAIVWRVYEDAAAVDPSVARDWGELQERRRETTRRLVGLVPATALRVGRELATDTVWTLASPQTYDLLVRRSGYPVERYGEWLRDALRRTLLTD